MAEKLPPKVAVVGRNVSAALWVKTLRSLHPTAEISWHRNQVERNQPEIPAWLFLGEDTKNQLSDGVPTIRVGEPYVFLNSSRRIPLSVFLKQGDPRNPQAIAPAIREKWAAISLFNDLSPSLWKNAGRPDPDWIRRHPSSFKNFETKSLWLAPRDSVLRGWEAEFQNTQIEFMPPDCGVFGIEANFFAEGHKLLHNAPFGYSTADRILWTSGLQTFKDNDEKKTTWRRLKTPRHRPSAQWVTRTAWIPEARVTGLPTVSFWLDPKSGAEFLESGIWRSGTLKRVICLPPQLTDNAHGSSWLQIEELISNAEPQTQSPSVDAFLEALCPGLFLSPRNYSEWRYDEGSLFREPEARTERLGRGIDFWHPSSLGNTIPAATRWQSKHLPLKKKGL